MLTKTRDAAGAFLRQMFARHQWREEVIDGVKYRECACGQREEYEYDDWGRNWIVVRVGSCKH